MRKAMPVARRVLGECHEITLKVRLIFAKALYGDNGATLTDLRECVETLDCDALVHGITPHVLGHFDGPQTRYFCQKRQICQ